MTPDLSNTLIAQFDAIIFHFDGNINDKDDIAALPIAASIAKAAGLEDKTTFFYGNNLSESNNTYQVEAMRESAAFAEKLGIDSHSYQDGIQQTTDRLVSILDSGQKVLAIEGGPMEAIYRALEQTSPENRGNVTLLSHSSWNENRANGTRPGGGTPRTWSDIEADFPDVTQIDIRDQNNGSNNDRGFNSFMWEWLDTTNNPVLQEARSLMENAQGKVNDPSDAGMLFYAITGQETANPDDAKSFFDAYPPTFSDGSSADGSTPPPPLESPPEPDPNPDADSDPMPDSDSGVEESLIRFALVNSETNDVVEGYDDLSAIAQLDLNGLDIDNYSVMAQINPNHPDADKVESVRFESNLGNQTENVVPYALFGDRNGNFRGKELTPGEVEIKATAYTEDRGQGEAIATANIAYSVIDSTPPANDPADSAPEPPASNPDPDPGSDSPPDMGMGNDAPPAATGDLISFALINAVTDEVVEGYENLGTLSEIDLAGLNVSQYSIAAQVNPNHPNAERIESIRFESNQGNQTENIVPYALFGDRNGDFRGEALAPGDVEIKATAYTENGGKGEAIATANIAYSVIDSTPPGITLAVAKEDATGQIEGTDGNDTISIRTLAGNSTTTDAGAGRDKVILYGADQIPEGNYHDMLESLKQNPVEVATEYFGATHSVDLGSGETDGADVLSLISEIDAKPKFLLKHTKDNGRINGKGVAGENNQAYDHWAGVFGMINIANFDPTGDALNLLGHTTVLGESFTQDDDFFQTVYSEQNANNTSGPRRGAAHDDTFLGLLKFEDGAALADAIADAITVKGMENYVVDGLGKQVYEGDPTSNQSGDRISPEDLLTFSLVNSKTDTIVAGYETLVNGAEINLNGLDLEKYSIVANVNPDHFYAGLVESVKFESNLGNQTESVVPYALFGDTKGDYRGQTPEIGDVALTATAYSKNGGNGKAIESVTLNYSIIDVPNIEMPDAGMPNGEMSDADGQASAMPESDDAEVVEDDVDGADGADSEMSESEIPDTETPESEMPESDSSETDEVDMDEAEAEMPESNTPESNTPESNMPEADTSDAEMPDAEMPEMPEMADSGDADGAESGGHSMGDHSGGHSTGHDHATDGDLMEGHGEHMAHLDDPSKQSEHMALFDLVPHGDATHVAVKDGSWFNPSTWAGSTIPGDDARVVIPKGVTVDYDGVSDADLFTLRVDGQLDFATDQNTQMVIDTFVVAPSGTLTIGSVDKPVQADVETRIIIADNGAIDIGWDPQQLSRGIVSHGTVEIHGAEKTPHLKLAEDAMAGDTELVLAEAPEGWQAGDRLVLTGTRYVKDQWNGSEMVWQGTQDEELTIKDIQGNTILLNEALQYDHDTPKDSLKASVANYSRNVVIETENHDTLPASQRGHVMFMHSDAVDVRYAEFYELGRTDKSKLIDDFKMQNGKRVLDADGNPIKNDPEDITNQRGRYAVHFHRTGVDNPDGEAAIAKGNAVWGSPGWGYAHHDSHLILEDNAAYDVFGSAFVTETGNETGAWRNNIAIKSEGMRSISKRGDRVNNQDIAHNGTGFWFQGRLVENDGNIAAGQRHSGITYLMRGVDQMDVLAENLPNPEIARYEDTLGTGKPPINGFQNNEVMASGMGFEVVKANPRQGHDIRSVVDGFTAWEVRTGTHLEYTSKYTLKDITVIGAESGTRRGISFGNNAEDMVVNRAYVEGFKTGVEFKKNHTFRDFNGDWQYALIDTELVDNGTDFKNLDSSEDKVLTRDDLVAGRLSFTPDDNADFVLSPDRSDRKVVITGTKTDSIGTVELPTGSDSLVFKFGSLKERLRQGYFVDAEGTRFFTVKETFADRATGDLLTQEYVVTLTEDWNKFTLGGTLRDVPELGTYDGVVTPGLVTDGLDAWLDQQWGTADQGSENQSGLDGSDMEPSIDSDTGSVDTGDIDTGSVDTGNVGTPANALSTPEFAQEVLNLTNEFRVENGRSPLTLNQDLTEAAQDHVEDMAQDDFFSHTGKDGSSVLDRVQEAGYDPRAVGENIAAGQTTPEQVVQGWINSPGHRANMLSENFTEIGIGYDFLANDTGSVNYNHYWAQVFGKSLDGTVSPAPAPTPSPVESPVETPAESPAAPSPEPERGASGLDLSDLSAYGGNRQNRALTTILGEDKTSVRMEGNGWRKLQVNHTITPETMLSFEFRSDAEGEIHSIGFDNNNSIQRGDRRTSFQLFGVQNWGIGDFETYMAQSGWQSFKIPVGEYLSGDMRFLTLGNDQDIANPDATSEFRNIMLYEAEGADTLGSNSSTPEDTLTGAMDSALTTLATSSDAAGLPM